MNWDIENRYRYFHLPFTDVLDQYLIARQAIMDGDTSISAKEHYIAAKQMIDHKMNQLHNMAYNWE